MILLFILTENFSLRRVKKKIFVLAQSKTRETTLEPERNAQRICVVSGMRKTSESEHKFSFSFYLEGKVCFRRDKLRSNLIV